MEQIHLKAALRQSVGKEKAKSLRASGFVPAIVYHRGDKPVSVQVAAKEMSRILSAHAGENILINLEVEKEKKARPVIIKEVQHDPVKRFVLHVDFNEISLTEKITVEVEVIADGEPIGVKQEGGSLDHPLRELKIQCLPTDIPKNIKVDVSHLKLNQAIHVRDLSLPENLKVLTDPDALLFQVKLHEEKVEEPTAEQPEVEVLREKKEEAGAEKAPAKEEPKAEKK